MKKLFSGFIAVLVFLSSFAFGTPTQAIADWNVSGSWTISFDYQSSPYVHAMTLSQDGSGALTGSGGYPATGTPTYTWALTSGSVSGNAINFSANYTAPADATTPQTTMLVTGTIAPNGTMSGTWSDNYQGQARTGSWVSASGAAQQIVSSTVLVSANTSAGENLPGWMFNRDTATATPFEFNTDAASIGTGSLYVKPIGTTAADKFIAENFINTPIANVNSISYDFKIGSGGVATEEEQFYMNVYANFGVSDDLKFYDCRYNIVPTVGSTGGFTTVTFDPTLAYPVTTRGGATPSPYACPAIPADMNTLSAGSNIRVFALNVGDTSTSDIGLDGYLDKVVVNTDTSVTTYNFDPAPVNTAPMLSGVPATATIPELALYTFTASAVDTDMPAQPLTFSLSGTVPAGASINASTGMFSWTPTEAQGPGVYTFSVMVSDGTLSDSESITITVTEVTDPITTPTDKDACKNGGWKTFTNPSFKNQGQCVSSVASNN